MSLAMYLLAVSMFSALAPRTLAQVPFEFATEGAAWVAPPLEDVDIGVNTLLTIATVIQLAIAITFPFRVRSQHIAPGMAAIIALLFMFLAYVLYIVFLVLSFITDGFGNLVASQQVIENITTVSNFFFNWTEPALFLTTAFVIRDRYLAYGKERNGESGWPLFPFMIVSYFLVVLMFTLSTASGGLAQAATSTNLSLTEADAMIKDSNDLLYAFVAFYMVATILLIPMAVVARKKARSDKIMNVTFFAIVPLLLVRAISRMILLIIVSHPPMTDSYFHFVYATNLSASIVEGIPYFIVVCILCYFFFSLRLWDGPGESNSHLYYVGGYQQHPLLQGGMPPVGQFPGQWGYPGMPGQQQQGQVPTNWPYQTYPLQQGAGGNYPNGQQQYIQQQQQPVTSGPGVAGDPVDDKSQGYTTEVLADAA